MRASSFVYTLAAVALSMRVTGPLIQPFSQAITSMNWLGHLPDLAYARRSPMFFLLRLLRRSALTSGPPRWSTTAFVTPPVAP